MESDQERPNSRFKIMRIAGEGLAMLFSADCRHVLTIPADPERRTDERERTLTITGFPEGAEIAGAYYNPDTHLIHFYVEHPSFPPMRNGEEIPSLVLSVEQSERPKRGREFL